MNASIMARLGLDTKGFKDGLRDADMSAKRFGDGVSGHFKGLGGILAGGAALAGVTSLVKGFANFASGITDTSEALGIGVESLQRWEYVASQGGASSKDFSKAIVKLNQEIDSAKNGNESALSSFEKLGIRFSDLENLSPEDVLLKIADATKNAANPTEALATACELLGNKLGSKLAPMLKLGSAGIKQLGNDASVVSAQMIKDAEKVEQDVQNLLKKGRAKFVNGMAQLGEDLANGRVTDRMTGGTVAPTAFEQERNDRALAEFSPDAQDAKLKAMEEAAAAERVTTPTPGGGRSGGSNTLNSLRKQREEKELNEIAQARAKAAERLMSADEKIVKLEEEAKQLSEKSKNLSGDELHQASLKEVALNGELDLLKKQKSESAEQLRIQQDKKNVEEQRKTIEEERLAAIEKTEEAINKLQGMARTIDKAGGGGTSDAKANDAADRKKRGSYSSEDERKYREHNKELEVRSSGTLLPDNQESILNQKKSPGLGARALEGLAKLKKGTPKTNDLSGFGEEESKMHGDPTKPGDPAAAGGGDMMSVLKEIATNTKTVADNYGNSI